MVLSSEELQQVQTEAQFDAKLASLFQTRITTQHYLIQCLADREIQKRLDQDYRQSKVYKLNCRVIHSPDSYSKVNER